MPVLGLGGLFFRARDPDALSLWYREHLGVGAGCVATEGATPDEWSWQAEGHDPEGNAIELWEPPA
jgi:hypothetical protein